MMANRTVRLVSGLFAAALAATSTSAAPEAEECLTKPNGAAPAGKHWYYNTNRETNRKCWFLADEGAKGASTSAKRPTISKQQPAATPPAEVDKDTPPAASPTVELIHEPKLEVPAASASDREPEAAPAATVGVATMPVWALASRWPQTPDVFSPGRGTANDPTPVAEAEGQSAAIVARRLVPIEQPSAPVVDSSEARPAIFEMKPPYIAAFLLVVIVLGGVTVMFVASRRGDRREFSNQWQTSPDDMQQREMPWTRPAQAAPASRQSLRRIGA